MSAAPSSRPQRVCILGATGSVGMATLDVISRHPERFEVVGLTAQQRLEELFALCRKFRPRHVVVATDDGAATLGRQLAEAGLRAEVRHGPDALCELAAHDDVDTVMAAIVGAAGLGPCLAAARSGKRLLLANKEALVVGGDLFMRAVREGGATLLPIDSEHSAIFQCLPDDRALWSELIDHIVLTASGGPFRGRLPQTLAEVTPDQACAHPNWVMGRKISVDSATMMNKALEVIEAHFLFDLPPERIEVVIHPQSIIHSMVVCRDQSVLAQLGTADMRVPIAYGLAWPQRIASGTEALDWRTVAALTFEQADHDLYPALGLAYEALRGPPGTSAVLNAANEEAVAAFLSGTIRFDRIHKVNARTMAAVIPEAGAADSIEALLALDAEARRHAVRFLNSFVE
ncbi:MAG: 1-deoxy-D-xylulose-5-phosphate reductoisomerase [Caldimonas sp.]